MSIQRLQDNRRICVPEANAAVCSRNAYFQAPVPSDGWNSNSISRIIYDGYAKFEVNPDYIESSHVSSSLEIGFIITVKDMGIGQRIDIWATNTQYETITEPGRYTGILTAVSGSANKCGLQQESSSTRNNGLIVEAFFFDSSKYTYEDFLVDPVAQISSERNPAISSASDVMPRLGFSSSIPVDPAAPWSSALQTVTPTPQGYVIAATNPVNTGQSYSKPVIASDDGIVKVRAALRAVNDKHAGIGIYGHNGTGYTLLNLSGFACRVLSGPGEVIASADELFILDYLSDVEDTVVEITATITVATASGFALLSKQARNTAGNAFAGEKTIISRFQLIDVDGAILLDAGPTPFYEKGDRLENSAWDGLFSTPIAWVCTAPGCPGTWKAVSLFDAYNSNPDPYMFGAMDGNPWTDIKYLSGDSIISSGKITQTITLSNGSYTLATTPANCCVQYELVTVETNVRRISGSGSARLRIADDTDLVIPFTTASVDKTVGGSGADQESFGLLYQVDVGSIEWTKALVRPKYPFLTQAPASFTAALANSQARGIPEYFDEWTNESAVDDFVFSAGAMQSATANCAMLLAPSGGIKAGSTIRIRINVTSTATSASIYLRALNNASAPYQVAIPQVIGLHELTVTATTACVQIEVYTNYAGFGFNYIRVYAE